MSTKLGRVIDLQHLLWRGWFNGVCTCGLCPKCGAHGARGSGLCFECGRKELGELVGPALANAYAKGIKNMRKLEQEMENKVGE